MYFIGDNEVFDFDLPFLSEFLGLLDTKLAEIDVQIDASLDPDGFGLFDSAEYLTGLGFVVCQRYITSTTDSEMDKVTALALPPTHPNGKTIAQLVNAVANAWKHSDEWPFGELSVMAMRTIHVIESVTPYKDYPACNLLYNLTGSPASLTRLLPMLEEWRDNVVAHSLAGREPHALVNSVGG